MKTSTNYRTQSLMTRLGVVIGSVAMLAACTSVQPPHDQMATSKAALNTAISTGANEFAPAQIKAATEKMTLAEKAMSDKNYAVATQQAEQALVDAQLATAISRAAKAKKAADALQEDSRILRQEIDRKTN